MDHQLYIIEGLPCSGKSTVSKYIADKLGQENKIAYFDEGSGNHPTDYEFHAYIKKEQLQSFTEKEIAEISLVARDKQGGYLIPLTGIERELRNKLLTYKIYDFLPWEDEKDIMLDGWKEFVENAEEDMIYVFNCCLIQNPMCETMMRFDFGIEESKEHIAKICDLIKQMHPVVIYLKNEDIRESVKNAAQERGEEWLESVIKYHESGAYGKANDIHGFAGYIDCLEERQRRELAILSGLPVEHYIIENAQRDWEKANRYIEELFKTKYEGENDEKLKREKY